MSALAVLAAHATVASGATVANADFERGEDAWRMKPAYSVPERHALADLDAEFSYAEPDGSRKTVKAATLVRDSAGLSVPLAPNEPAFYRIK